MRVDFVNIGIDETYYIIQNELMIKIYIHYKNDKKVEYRQLTQYDWNGKIIYGCIDGSYCYLYREEKIFVFTTKKEAFDFIKKRRRFIIDKYKSKIKTVKDLLELPFRVLINDDDEYYINYYAREAYKERCKELLGVKISTDNLKWLSEIELRAKDEFDN
jgi:hypothetical protein